MSNKRGRKRHLVDGDVAEIKKSEEGLKMRQVGERRNFVSRLLKRIRREERDK